MPTPRAESWAQRLAARGVPLARARRLVLEWEDHRAALAGELAHVARKGAAQDAAALRRAVRRRLGGPAVLLRAAHASRQRRRGVIFRHPRLTVALTPAAGLAALLGLGLLSVAAARGLLALGLPPESSAARLVAGALALLTAEAPWPVLGLLVTRRLARAGHAPRHALLACLLLGLTGAAAWVGFALPSDGRPGAVGVGLGLLVAPWRLLTPLAAATLALRHEAARARTAR